MKYSLSYQEPVELNDGKIVTFRAIQPSDKSALSDAFEELSLESRRRRFLASKSGLTDKELNYFTEIDGVNHYAIVAVVTTAEDGAQSGAGVARIVRTDDDPAAAELAIVIADAWQRRGIGRKLLERIVAVASERGIKRIRAMSLADNDQLRGLLEKYDDGVEVGPTRSGVLQFTLTVPPPDRHAAMDAMISILRLAALVEGTDVQLEKKEEDRSC
ncbi:MAG: GNAT family N-acetyltransferase [Woeseia sp.]|nr:GNAT family N-acetyltransferase [Woeseia sp.]